MFRKFIFTIILFSFLITINGKSAARPKIGLVLSGGGARGFAHVGVLKVLEEAGIKPDYITGTSIGSIIGALYAIGYDAKSLEKIIKKLDWQEIMSDKIKRSYLSIESKDNNDFITALPIKDYSIKLPDGLIKGRKFSLYLSRYTFPVHGVNDFNDFYIPFKCVATNLLNGKAYVFDKGNLANALRASMSIPSAFSPKEYDGKLLIDGGIVRNLPASDVIKMSADIVIGVDTSTPLYTKNNLNTFFNVIDQAVSFQINRSTTKERKLCNYLVTPNIKEFQSNNFNSIDSLISRGEQEARKILPKLLLLAKQQREYLNNESQTKSLGSINLSEKKEVYLSKIRIKGLENYSTRMIQSKMGIVKQKIYHLKDIHSALFRLEASDLFSSINYELISLKKCNISDDKQYESYKLIIYLKENYDNDIKFAINYNSDEYSSLIFRINLKNKYYTGSNFSLKGKLNQNPSFKLTHSLITAWDFGLGLYSEVFINNFDAFLYSEGEKTASYDVKNFGFRQEVGSIMFNDLNIGCGFLKQVMNINALILSSPEDYYLSEKYNSIYAFIKSDTQDDIVFPKSGYKLEAYYKFNSKDINNLLFSEESQFQLVFSSTNKFFLDNLFLTYSINGGFSFGEEKNQIFNNFYLGGQKSNMSNFIPFSGFAQAEIASRNVITGKVAFNYEFLQDKFIITNFSRAIIADKFNQLYKSDATTFDSVSLGIGFKTLLGPINISLFKLKNQDKLSFYIFAGFPF